MTRRPAEADREPPWRNHSRKGRKAVLGVLWAIAAVTPAAAARCPQGEILRVRLHECVGIHSRLALAYVRPLRHMSRWRSPVADADPPPADPQPPKPHDDQAALTAPLVLPGLEDGAPDTWRFCQASPNLCAGDR